MSLNIEQFLESGSLISSGKGKILIGWGSRSWKSSAKDGPTFYFPDFFLKESRPWFSHQYTTEIDVIQLLDSLTSHKQNQQKISAKLTWNCCYQPEFQDAFHALQEEFHQATLKKAVPYIFETTQGTFDSDRLLNSLLNVLLYAANQKVYLYGFWDTSQGILGATPELLFQLNGRNVKTMACAGTRRASEPGASLLEDPKELHEHNLVVEGITQSLSSFGCVEKSPIEVLKLPNLSHLVTSINVKLDHEPSFDTIVKVLHPTPALGAFPRARGQLWLEQYQTKIPRNRYGAPVGYVSPTNSNCYVAIRNVQWDKDQMRIGAGCGVVAASLLEREWQEIKLKIHAIKEILAL